MQHPFMGPGPTRSTQLDNFRTGGSFVRNRLNSDWWGTNIFSKVFEGFDGFDALSEEFDDGSLGFEMAPLAVGSTPSSPRILWTRFRILSFCGRHPTNRMRHTRLVRTGCFVYSIVLWAKLWRP